MNNGCFMNLLSSVSCDSAVSGNIKIWRLTSIGYLCIVSRQYPHTANTLWHLPESTVLLFEK